jgi:hypothetical protein
LRLPSIDMIESFGRIPARSAGPLNAVFMT